MADTSKSLIKGLLSKAWEKVKDIPRKVRGTKADVEAKERKRIAEKLDRSEKQVREIEKGKRPGRNLFESLKRLKRGRKAEPPPKEKPKKEPEPPPPPPPPSEVRVSLRGNMGPSSGFALRFLKDESRARRYVADASYWVYLVHLPIVMALQVAVGRWPLHWSIKFPLVVTATLALAFVSYHFLVRSTFIGGILSGRKYPRRRDPAATSVAAATAPVGPIVAELQAVTKRYGATVALDGVDLAVRRGEVMAVLGRNGAGKSTAISLWLGLHEPDAGTIKLMSASPHALDSRRNVGVMMQEAALTPELRVRELIALTSTYYPNPLGVDETLALSGCAPLASRPYGKLSTGQKRLVQFAIAICGRPQLLFLDEQIGRAHV